MAATLDTSAAAPAADDTVAAMKQQLQLNQQLVHKDPPPIPHIQENFIPLQTVITNLIYYASAELRNILETLPSTASDMVKKRRLLDFIVKLRMQFVKVYVLTKWSYVSRDISKTIDAVSWLNGQQNCFQNVIHALVDIDKSLGGAKLRNPDIETALEVLTSGRPSHSSRGFVSVQKLSPSTILQTLHDLNILLSIRLALTEKLPPQFSHYQIANGRVTFYVEDSYQVQLGIADDSVDARFFLIDFQFDYPGAYPISSASRAKLENIANNMLPTRGLVSVFDMLLKFTQNAKLSMFYAELSDLARGLYAGLIAPKFYPDRSLVTVHYWLSPNRNSSSSSSSGSARNMIEIGLQRNSKNIGIRWHREGKVVTGHDIEFGQTNTSAEWLLQEIATLHVQHNIATVHRILSNIWGNGSPADKTSDKKVVKPTATTTSTTSPKDQPTDSTTASPANASPKPTTTTQQQQTASNELVTLVSPEKLKIKLTDTRYTIYSIDRLTGCTILTNSTKLVGSVEAALNENTTDRPAYVAELLIKLRYASLQDEITSRAKSCGWVIKTGLAFSSEVVRTRFPPETKLVFCMRQPSWPARWFVLVTIGANSQPRWWIAQLVMKESAWHILFLEEIRLSVDNSNGGSGQRYDYRLFEELGTFTVGHIKTEALCKELDKSNVKYKLFQTSKKAQTHGAPVILVSMKTLCEGSWAEETVFLTLQDQFPGKTTATMQGKTKNQIDLGSMTDPDSGVKFEPATGIFTLTFELPDSCEASPASLSGRYSAPVLTASHGGAVTTGAVPPFRSEFVEHMRNKFSQIERIVSYVNLLKSLNLELREASMHKIIFEYGPGMLASITLDPVADHTQPGQSLSETAVLKLHENSPHHCVEPFLQAMLNTDGLLSVVWVLQTALPLYVGLRDIMSRPAPAAAGGGAQDSGNLLASVPVIMTPHSIIDITLYFPARRTRIHLKLMEANNRPLQVFVTESVQGGTQPSLSGPAVPQPLSQQGQQGQQAPGQQPRSSTLLSPLWTQKWADVPQVIPLVQGLACPVETIGPVLNKIFDMLVN